VKTRSQTGTRAQPTSSRSEARQARAGENLVPGTGVPGTVLQGALPLGAVPARNQVRWRRRSVAPTVRPRSGSGGATRSSTVGPFGRCATTARA